MLLERIKSEAKLRAGDLVAWRRHLHRYPELSYQERETAAFVARTLNALGVRCETGVGDTGVVGYVEGEDATRTVALRADMDALPINEANETEYCSTRPGVMHACGHDAHTACLLGAAAILQAIRPPVNVKLIFQPGEEKLPGGATLMMRDGALNDVRHIIGQHVMPLIPAGKVGVRSGKYMASSDEIYLTVRGRGGHGAQPHLGIDPIAIAAQIVVATQQLVSRRADPRMPTVLTFGKIIAHGATNVIPNEVYLEGTFRTFDETWRETAHKLLRQMVESIAEGMGAVADLQIVQGYPTLYNDPELTAQCRTVMERYVGRENVVEVDLWPASEDFAYYTQQTSGLFYRLGTRNESKGIVHGLHTPRFDIDETALEIGAGLMAALAVETAR
jgi:amidohydrolase